MFKKDRLLKKDFEKKTRILCKAQVAITDLFIALFIATILIIGIISVWNGYVTLTGDNVYYNDLQISAFQVANVLVKSGGNPRDWELDPDSVDTIGLARSDRSLSEEKVDAFVNLSLNVSSKSLGVELYDFYFQLKHINGTKLKGYGTSTMPNRSIVNIQRLVLYKNEKAVVEFALWK